MALIGFYFLLKGCISSLQVFSVNGRQLELDISRQFLVHVFREPHWCNSLLTDAQYFVLLSLIKEHTQKLNRVVGSVRVRSRVRILQGLRQGQHRWVDSGFHHAMIDNFFRSNSFF